MNSNTPDSPLIDAAIGFAAKGWAIVPLHNMDLGKCSCRRKSACGTPGKHPRLSGWTTKGSTDFSQLRKWWKQWPLANIGIVTGQLSDIVVVDVDSKSGGLDTLRQLVLEYPDLQSTFAVKTGGGGWHFYFARPLEALANKVGTLPGIDLRAENGLVVAAGSTHHSGGRYEVFRNADVLPLPTGLCDVFSKRTQERHKSTTRTPQEHRRSNVSKEDRRSTEKRILQLDVLSPKQTSQIREAVSRSVPDEPGRRNQHVFELGRRLMAIDGITSETNPESFRPVVKHFHDQLIDNAARRGFEVSGSFAQTMDDFRYAWDRIHTPMDKTMAVIIEQSQNAIRRCEYPDSVSDCVRSLCYQDDTDTVALIVLLWFLAQHWNSSPFFLSARSGADTLQKIGTVQERSHQWVNRQMTLLERDGVIECIERSKPGQRNVASVFQWSWHPSVQKSASLDWLR